MAQHDDWLPQAQALRVGGHAKHPHYCGDGRPLVVFHNEVKWSAYCHRCGSLGSVYKPLPTLQERLAIADRERQQELSIEADRRPPMPAVYDMAEWPLEARVWVFKAGLSQREALAFGIYYHPPTRRVVVPVVSNGALTFWQARRIFGTTGAKYLSMPGGREHTLPLYGSGSSLVLVEDLLSCFKISTAGCTSLCLMGTKLLPVAMDHLLRSAEPVLIWLDPDAAGQNAAAEIKNQLAMVGIPCSIVGSHKDPKFYSRSEIVTYVARHQLATDDAGTKGLRQVNPSSQLALIGTTDGSDPH